MDSYNPVKKQRSPQQKLLLVTLGVLGLALVFWVFSWFSGPEKVFIRKAVVVLSGDSSVNGTVIFEQTAIDLPVTIKGDLKGLDPNSLRGFHIHQSGDLTNGCLSAGSHYNPLGKTHGAPSDTNRHVGDLGNIKTDKDGYASFAFQDSQISLNGPFSILGRSVVVHTGTDDLGQGGNDESLKTGNAGGRAACGVIGIVS